MEASRTRSVRAANAADDAQIEALARDPRWAPLRYLDRFGFEVAGSAQAERIRRLLDDADDHLVAVEDGEVVATGIAHAVDDLASHFHHPVYEVALLVASDHGERSEVATLVLDALTEQVTGPQAGLIMVRIEADDHALVEGAQRAGFIVRETSLTFVNDLERANLNTPSHDPGGVRLHRFATDGPLPDEIRSAIERGGRLGADHYHADPRLDDEQCDELYLRAARRVANGIGADVLALRFLEDQLVGFGSWRRWDELEHLGVDVAGSSFGFRVHGAPPGNLSDVASFVCNHPITGNRLLEWTTQATNYSMVNMLFRQPSIRLCRTSVMLHRWTDDR